MQSGINKMSEWNFDMDAAPRDGTELIGFRPDQGVFVFRWATMDEFLPEDVSDFECWWHDRWDWMEGDLTPTAWMPLPPPPQVQERTDR